MKYFLLLILLVPFAHSRGPAVEGLHQMDMEQIDREREGKSYSNEYLRQFEALEKGQSDLKVEDNQSLIEFGFTSLVLAFAISFPMILAHFIKITSPFTEEETGTQENIVYLTDYRKDQYRELDQDQERKAG